MKALIAMGRGSRYCRGPSSIKKGAVLLMIRFCSNPGLLRRILFFATAILWSCLPTGARDFASPQEQSVEQIALLGAIREKIRNNESLFQLIKMDWSVEKVWMSPPSKSPRAGGRRITSHEGMWAQDGILQHWDRNSFSDGESLRSYITVFDGEVVRNGLKPDFMSGTISPVEKSPWHRSPMMYLGIRLFDVRHRTTDLLVPEHAWVEKEKQEHRGRPVYVVNVIEPGKPHKLAKLYIDCERNMPVNIKQYRKDRRTGQDHVRIEIKDIELYQLPNGGWFPVSGSRRLYFDDSFELYDGSNIKVDTSSLTIRREDIPEELFTFEFPQGAKVFNEILGVRTTIGQKGGTTAVVDSVVDETLYGLEGDVNSPKQATTGQTPTPSEAVELSDSNVSADVNEERSVRTDEPNLLAEGRIRRGPGALKIILTVSAFLTGFAVLMIVIVYRSGRRADAGGKHNGR